MANTRAQNLDLVIDSMAQRLADILQNPQPSYSIDGKSFSLTEYQTFLIQQMKTAEEARQRADGAFEDRGYAVSG